MSIKIINDIFDNSEMTGNDRLVMIAIADNADTEKRQAWPSVREISRKTRIPIRTVWRCIKRCVASGELSIVRSGTHEGESNLYEVLVRRSSPQPSDKMTGVPPNGIPPMPPIGTLTVIEPSVHTPTKARGSKEEIMNFCLEEDLPETDGDWFFNKMEGNGWKNNGQKVMDWKATIRAWKKAGYMASQKSQKPWDRGSKQPLLFPSGPKTRTVYEITKIIEAKQKLNDELKRRFSADVAGGTQWTNEPARLEFVAHKKEIKQLNEQLAGM